MLLGIGVVVGCVALSVLALWAVRRRVPLEMLREQHDVAAACFAVIGGLYGIVLAFVLVSSWQRFEEARERAEVEANALADLYRHASALPAQVDDKLRGLVLAYAKGVIDEEWAAMSEGRPSVHTQAIFDEMWATLLNAPSGDGKELVLFQNTLGKMDDFSDARRDRLLFARVGMPTIVWVFLIASGAVTIGFSYFFGLRQVSSQMLMTAALAGTIGAALVLIAELQTPFAGSVRVTPYGFEQLVVVMSTRALPRPAPTP
ncbi:DUF4239 domain-containing protein [Candidatus Binatia bacterium]|nr:DUF4239 domain-containing protein [Candidatus Binatia bacterium]